MNRIFGLSIILNNEQLKFLINNYRIDINGRSVIPINKQIQLLMFYDEPVLFISYVTNIETFTRITNKYKNMLNRING